MAPWLLPDTEAQHSTRYLSSFEAFMSWLLIMQISAYWRVATKLHDAGEASILQQQRLAPELKTLLQLSKDRHSGWLARFDEALKPLKHPAGALTQSMSSKSHCPEPLEGHNIVWVPARPVSNQLPELQGCLLSSVGWGPGTIMHS